MDADNGDTAEQDVASRSSFEFSETLAVEDKATVENLGLNEYGCEHYRRRCMLIAPCCGEQFWCRHCHNIAKHDNEQDPVKRHVLDRKAIREVVCALCNTRQPAATNCNKCGVGFGKYSCLVCHFYDDDVTKEQFHCADCGICRVGGRQNFFHCDTCNCCYAVMMRDSHRCIENSMHSNCPVCFEYLFDSIRPISVMPCGHTIHQECLRLLVDHSTYHCPVCFKSCMTTANMERIWQDMDENVEATPMPEDYASIEVNILCNDCGDRSRVHFHILGHKCSRCGGYNTRRI